MKGAMFSVILVGLTMLLGGVSKLYWVEFAV
jgi:hypothetical protein